MGRTGGAAPSAQRQAVMWEVCLREGTVDEAQLRAFDTWRRAAAANSQAWEALQERLARMGGASRASASMAHALRAPANCRSPRSARGREAFSSPTACR